MSVSILITMISAGVITAVGEEIAIALGKMDYAKWIKTGGTSLVISLGVGLVYSVIKQVSGAFAGGK